MKSVFILAISFFSCATILQAQSIAPYMDGQQTTITINTQKDFRLPVSVLLPNGSLASSVLVRSFSTVQSYHTPKTSANTSKAAQTYFIKQLEAQNFKTIFRCKDDCKDILKRILSKLLPTTSEEYKQFAQAKRYSYAIFHRGDKIALAITLHGNSAEVYTCLGFTNLK